MELVNHKAVGKRLKELRESTLFKDGSGAEKPLSSRGFAVKAGVDVSQYSKIEKGELPLTDSIMDKLENTYGFNKGYLLFGKDVPKEGWDNLTLTHSEDDHIPGLASISHHGSHKQLDQDINTRTILKLAEANEKLADANQRLTAMLEKQQSTASAPGQIPEAFDAMIGNLLESIADVVSEKKPRSKNEVAALLSKAFHAGARDRT